RVDAAARAVMAEMPARTAVTPVARVPTADMSVRSAARNAAIRTAPTTPMHGTARAERAAPEERRLAATAPGLAELAPVARRPQPAAQRPRPAAPAERLTARAAWAVPAAAARPEPVAKALPVP